MKIKELHRIFDENIEALSKDLTPKNLILLNKFLHTLEMVGMLEVDEIIPRMKRWKSSPKNANKPKSPAMTDSSANVLSHLNQLYDEVRNWSDPDYDRVREEVTTLCKGLKKADLVPLARKFTGEGAMGDNKSTLLEYLMRPILTRLQRKFIFVRT